MQDNEYEPLEMTVTEFDCEDVITTSVPEMRRERYEYKLLG